MSLTGLAQTLNGTILPDTVDAKTKAIFYEDQVFKITLLSVALIVLAVTGIIACISYRRRKRKWAYVSSAVHDVAEDPVDLTYARTTQSFHNPFRRQEELKHNSHIYYIFSNPTPVVLEDDAAHQKTPIDTLLTLQDYANNPKSDVTVNPPFFYMQL